MGCGHNRQEGLGRCDAAYKYAGLSVWGGACVWRGAMSSAVGICMGLLFGNVGSPQLVDVLPWADEGHQEETSGLWRIVLARLMEKQVNT